MKEKLLYLMLILFVSASVFAQTGGEMGMTNVVSANNARQLTWCFEHKTVVEHLYLNFRALNTVIAMANGVHHHLLYYKLGVFAVGFEKTQLYKI